MATNCPSIAPETSFRMSLGHLKYISGLTFQRGGGRPGKVKAAPDQLLHIENVEFSYTYQHIASSSGADLLNPKLRTASTSCKPALAPALLSPCRNRCRDNIYQWSEIFCLRNCKQLAALGLLKCLNTLLTANTSTHEVSLTVSLHHLQEKHPKTELSTRPLWSGRK